MKTFNLLCDMCGYIMPHDKWAWITVKRNFTNAPLTLCRECSDKLVELIEKRNHKDQELMRKITAKRAAQRPPGGPRPTPASPPKGNS